MEGTIVKRFRLEDTITEIELELFPHGEVLARFVNADAEWCPLLDVTLPDDRHIIKALFPEVTA